MHKKLTNVSAILFLSLLVFSIIVCGKSTSEPVGDYPLVYVSPEGVADVDVGEVFTVIVGVSSLVDRDLYGFDIKFKWNIDALEYVGHEVKVPVEAYLEGVLHDPVVEVKNEVDASAGTLWVAYASLSPAEPFNQEGVFFAITFVLHKESDDPFALEYAILVSYNGKIIPVNGCQSAEISTSPPNSEAVNELRKLRAEEWLEWWITVTFHLTKRRP